MKVSGPLVLTISFVLTAMYYVSADERALFSASCISHRASGAVSVFKQPVAAPALQNVENAIFSEPKEAQSAAADNSSLFTEPLDRPSFQEGDCWQFKINRNDYRLWSTNQLRGIYELNFIDGEFRAYRLEGTQKLKLDLSPHAPARALLSYLGLKEGEKGIDIFPIWVGKEQTYEFESYSEIAKKNIKNTATIQVPGLETVECVAGTFRAFKILRETFWVHSSAQGTSHNVYYYSPETKSIIKSHIDLPAGESDAELINFGSLEKIIPLVRKLNAPATE